MPKFLFWNLNKRELPGFVRNLAREADADVLILAECSMPAARLLEELNAEEEKTRPTPKDGVERATQYQYAWGNCDHLVFFTRFDARMMQPLYESRRVSIRRLAMPGRQPLIVAAAHLPSKVSYSDESQVFESVQLARMIEEVERAEKHHRTILLGDLNMNPFEAGMVGARGGLNAVMSRQVAGRDVRTVQGEKYKFFYNPMWSHLGDRAETGGTFFYDQAEPVCYFWNMFDQVLLRPDLLKGFEPEHVRILTEVRGYSLLQGGRPDREMASDHLPVMVELNF